MSQPGCGALRELLASQAGDDRGTPGVLGTPIGRFLVVASDGTGNQPLVGRKIFIGANVNDGRRVCLSVTRRGRDLLIKLAPAQIQVNDVLFGFLDAAQFRQLGGMVDRMTACGDRAVSLLDYLAKAGPTKVLHKARAP